MNIRQTIYYKNNKPIIDINYIAIRFAKVFKQNNWKWGIRDFNVGNINLYIPTYENIKEEIERQKDNITNRKINVICCGRITTKLIKMTRTSKTVRISLEDKLKFNLLIRKV